KVILSAKREIEHAGILEKELPLFWKEQPVWSEIEFLRVYVGIGEVGIRGEVGNQVGAQAKLYIEAAGVESVGAWVEPRSRRGWWKMTETQKPIRLDDEQASAADFGDPVQLPRLTDPRSPVGASPTRPELFFIFATNEPLEIDAPYNVARAHEV